MAAFWPYLGPFGGARIFFGIECDRGLKFAGFIERGMGSVVIGSLADWDCEVLEFWFDVNVVCLCRFVDCGVS